MKITIGKSDGIVETPTISLSRHYRPIHLHTQKVRVSKLNNCKTLAYAVTYLKMLSTTQNYNTANRKCVK